MVCVVALSLSSCFLIEDMGSLFVLVRFSNNSDDTLIVFDSILYPDTIFPYYDERQLRADYYIIPPHRTNDIDYPASRTYIYKKISALQLFVYNYSVVKHLDGTDLRDSKYLLRRYELTKEWMEEHDWTVTYP